MKRDFIQHKEVTIEKVENKTLFSFVYNRIKEIAAKRELVIDGEKLKVGHEVFFGVNTEGEGPHVVAALCCGYEVVSGFHQYDDETGEVDFSCNPIYLGEDGNTYRWTEDIITSVFDTLEEADECLAEMIGNEMA